MADNSNNYIATELAWTPYSSTKDLPVGVQLVFKTPDGKLMFGRVRMTSNNHPMMVVDGHFDFDRQADLDVSEWACIEFVFETD